MTNDERFEKWYLEYTGRPYGSDVRHERAAWNASRQECEKEIAELKAAFGMGEFIMEGVKNHQEDMEAKLREKDELIAKMEKIADKSAEEIYALDAEFEETKAKLRDAEAERDEANKAHDSHIAATARVEAMVTIAEAALKEDKTKPCEKCVYFEFDVGDPEGKIHGCTKLHIYTDDGRFSNACGPTGKLWELKP